jgi:predicted RNase H-like HicB family nuclease
MNLTVEIEREEDGRWIAEVVDLPGVLVYAQTVEEATSQVQALASRVLADRLEHGESGTAFINISFEDLIVFFHVLNGQILFCARSACSLERYLILKCSTQITRWKLSAKRALLLGAFVMSVLSASTIEVAGS